MAQIDVAGIMDLLLQEAARGDIAWRLALSFLVVVGGLVALRLFQGMLSGLVQARVIDRSSRETIYRITKAAVYMAIILTIIFIFTGSTFVMALLLVGFFGLIIASWDIISNLVSYYIIIGMRLVGQGEYLVLPNGIHGKVRDIKPLHIILESPHGLYSIPNIVVIRDGMLQRRETFSFRITVRVWGLQDVHHIENVKEIVRSVVSMRAKELLESMTKPLLFIDEVSDDSVTIKIVINTPGARPRLEKLSQLIVELSKRLRESGYSHTITFETPEGYGQRWRTVE